MYLKGSNILDVEHQYKVGASFLWPILMKLQYIFVEKSQLKVLWGLEVIRSRRHVQ